MENTRFGFVKSDFLKGLLMAVIGAVIGIVAPSVESMSFVFDFTIIWHTAAAAAFTYLVKQYFTDTNGAAIKALDNAGVKDINIPEAKEKLKTDK